MNKNVIIIIPARYNSSRFPGKPLELLDGKPIICRVIESVNKVIKRVVTATDDVRIFDKVNSFGYESVMTSSEHNSGTERVIEAFEKIGKSEDIIVNIQGDEPFIKPEQILQLIEAFDDTSTDIATLIEEFPSNTSNEELFDTSKVKVVKQIDNTAIYFSRYAIPYQRDNIGNWCENTKYYKHIGIYAFRADVLRSIKNLPHSSLENSERLEQLRWIENGFKIKALTTKYSTIGIDTHEDLKKAEEYIKTLKN